MHLVTVEQGASTEGGGDQVKALAEALVACRRAAAVTTRPTLGLALQALAGSIELELRTQQRGPA